MKKTICFSLLSIIVIICSVQVYYVNSHSIEVPACIYNTNDEVMFDDNFFNNSNESSFGYAITVLDTEQIDIESFKSKYSIKGEIGIEPYDYVSLVHVKIKNCSNSDEGKSGIDMQHFFIQNGSYISYFYSLLYSAVNTHPETKFYLSKSDEMEFWIPFVLDNNELDINEFNVGDVYLVLSLYPQKRMIKL